MDYLHQHLAFLLLLLLLPTTSSQENPKTLSTLHPSSHKMMSSKLLYEIKVHGFLLWASMGFFMPIGILFIRMSNSDHSPFLFYLHAISQIVALIMATIGAVMSIRNFNNSFTNFHQRLGVGLYFLIWFQAFLGFFRPSREKKAKARRRWIVGHWLIGISLCILGIINIYTGLDAYTSKTFTSVKLWTLLFTIQLSCFAFFYLLQEKCSHILNHTTSSPPNLCDQNGISTAGDEFRETTPAPEKC